MWFSVQVKNTTILSTQRATPPTEEAIDDPEEAAHGADNRRDNFIAPLDLLVTAKDAVSTATLRRWGELKGEQLGRGGHDDHLGELVLGRDGEGRNSGFKWVRKGQEEFPIR